MNETAEKPHLHHGKIPVEYHGSYLGHHLEARYELPVSWDAETEKAFPDNSLPKVVACIFDEMGIDFSNENEAVVIRSHDKVCHLTAKFNSSVVLKLPIMGEWERHVRAYRMACSVMLWVAKSVVRYGDFDTIKLADDATKVDMCHRAHGASEARKTEIPIAKFLHLDSRNTPVYEEGGPWALEPLFQELDDKYTPPDRHALAGYWTPRFPYDHGMHYCVAYDSRACTFQPSLRDLQLLLHNVIDNLWCLDGGIIAHFHLVPDDEDALPDQTSVYFIGLSARLNIFCRCRRLFRSTSCKHKPIALWLRYSRGEHLSPHWMAAMMLVAELVVECNLESCRMVAATDGTVRIQHGAGAKRATISIQVSVGRMLAPSRLNDHLEPGFAIRICAEKYCSAIRAHLPKLPSLVYRPSNTTLAALRK